MLEIESTKNGAELTSVKLNGEERLHDGNSFWNRHSPVLFPIVGKLKDGKTLINGKSFEMGQHGFARDMLFQKIGENSYILKSNEETLKKYPFKFELYVSYKIKNDILTTRYKVINKDKKNILFGLGGHPAFKCNYSKNDCEINFDRIESKIEFYGLENGLVNPNKIDKENFMKNNKIVLHKDIFKNDAIIMKNLNSHKVILKENGTEKIEFEFTGFKYLALWSKEDAPFVCIEPWFNTADKTNSSGKFEDKENIIELKPGEEFISKYKVKFI